LPSSDDLADGDGRPHDVSEPRVSESISPATRRSAEPGGLDIALHEISNSLTAVLGWLEVAARTADGESRDAVLGAMRRVRQAHRIARIAIGAKVLPEPPRPLIELVADVVRGLSGQAETRGAIIEWQLFPDLRTVLVIDGERLTRVLTNLLLNAVEHSGPGERIRLVGDTAGVGHAMLSVTDEGPGIPDELRDGLLSAQVSARPGGTGIGLAHASELARAAGGSIRLVPSEKGAHFAIGWPVIEASALAFFDGHSTYPDQLGTPALGHATKPPASGTLTNMRLLLVEDDLAISDMLRSALMSRGATVRVVGRRRDLQAALEESTYHGVLLDLSPIADDVAGVLALVHAKNPSARILMISGSVEGLPVLAPEIVITWVQKPFELEDVVRALVVHPSTSLRDIA
jgi:two-component sensor histidine kinase